MVTKALDNRYGRVKYGQTKYGASAPYPSIAWGLEIDWNGDGLFDGSNESGRLVGLSGFRGRRMMLKADGSGFEVMETGSYTFTLDNSDYRYTPWNGSSPLYPNVFGGKDVRVRLRDRNGSSIYDVFFGIMQDPVPIVGGDGKSRVQITVEDALSYLRNNKARVQVAAALTTDQAIGKVLDAVDWPRRWGRNLDVSTDTMTYYWASGQIMAGEECENLAHSGAGTFLVDARGRARYITRTDIPAAVLSLSENDLLKNVAPQVLSVNRRNIVRMTVHPMTKATSGVIWKLSGTAPKISPGAANALIFTANYSYNSRQCSAFNVLQPVPGAGNDWQANTIGDGSGTDKTANCTFEVVDNGDNALCIITNNSAGDVYLLSGAQIKGDAIYTQDTVEAMYPASAAAIQSPREFKQDLPWQQNINVATDLVTVLGPFFESNRPVVIAPLQDRPDIQFIPDLMDIVTASFPTYGLSANSYRVAGIGHQSQDEACQDILTTLYLEPYPTVANAGIYDTSVYATGVYGW